MRVFAALILVYVLGATSSAHAAPDLSPIGCAWEKLPEAERTRLSDEFRVELKERGFTILFGTADAARASEAAGQCLPNRTQDQTEQLALGLARHAGELKAKKGIIDHGAPVDTVNAVLEKMHQGKREVIGDRLACPGPQAMVTEWDQSLKSAVRRANLQLEDQHAYAFVSLAAYAIMAQEGTMRRLAGTAGVC